MRQIKSERLKKLEQELFDLEQWMKLGLVPKNDISRHEEEIESIKAKIEEEKERLQFLKESGDTEEYTPPKRQPRTAYTEVPTIPDIDMSEANGSTDTSFEMDTNGNDNETSMTDDDRDDDETSKSDEDEESFFSDRQRWKRGFKDIVDPDANEW